MTLHHGNPFGVIRNWFTVTQGPAAAWPLFVEVNALAGVLIALFGLRAAFRLKGHFHDRHYRPIESGPRRSVRAHRHAAAVLVGGAARDGILGPRQRLARGRILFPLFRVHHRRESLAAVDGAARLPDLRCLGRCTRGRDRDVRAGRGAGRVSVRTVGLDDRRTAASGSNSSCSPN